MKVKITERAKKFLTLEELPVAKQVINDLKEDNELENYGKIAARIASGTNETFEILKAEAEISHNRRVYDAFCEGSGKIDIWMEFYAYNAYAGFYEIGVYLTDLWNSTGDNSDEIKSHMFILEFKRKV